ncbi:hypothetical protein BAU01nite_23400 [Brevibacterium aurantiacum]|uniref:Uncharacterized protein n=2 Tax=Brevibacterium aurantiacum TaxID=273384 RepID=A0A2H1KLX7_BREAU|nr:hypothetical protein BAU01nite_23400 [Brevibacterium aurantiacum]SMY00598.1 hypothetical protein BAUR9175_03618 [Brevibacterium aurantiacum]
MRHMDERPRNHLDPTKIGDQAALRSSSGTIWIVSGGLFLLAVAVVLVWIAVSSATAAPLAIATGAAVVALYIVLLLVRFLVRPGKVRLRIMAAAMIGMALIAVVGLLASVGAESAPDDADDRASSASYSGVGRVDRA